MNCDVCESSNFALVEGVYYCCECNNEVQSSRQEQGEQEEFSRRFLIRSPKAQRKEVKKKKMYDDWITPEAYTIILRKQVSALISYGASEKLKDVVLNIWCRYMQKCEIAFREDYMAKISITPRLGIYASNRDVQLLYGNKEAGLKIKKRKKRKKKSGWETSDSEISSSEEFMNSDLAESDMQSDDISDDREKGNTSESSSESVPVFKKVKLSSAAYKAKLYGKKRDVSRTRMRLVHELDLAKTLSICYLGLLYTRDHLLLSDIYRFATEKKIPYLYASEYIPSSKKLLIVDFKRLAKKKVPDISQISLMSSKLVNFLKLPSFKHRPLMPIVYRFVTDLNLPGRIILVVQSLLNMRKINEDDQYVTKSYRSQYISRIPVYETQAMAAIIVALKMIYVLDGKYELVHSEAMRKINNLLKNDKLFVWNEWRQQMSLKEHLFLKNGPSCSDLSNLDKVSTDLITKYPCFRTSNISEEHLYNKNSRNEIQAMLEELFHVNNLTSVKPSSFPIKSQLDNMMSNWKKWHFFKETEKIDFTFISKDFSSCLLFYEDNDENEDLKKLIHILLSSLYKSAEVYTSCDAASFSENFATSSKYWFKVFPHRVYSNLEWTKQLPESFVSILQLLSKYIHVTCKKLYLEVLKIEKKCLRVHLISSEVNVN